MPSGTAQKDQSARRAPFELNGGGKVRRRPARPAAVAAVWLTRPRAHTRARSACGPDAAIAWPRAAPSGAARTDVGGHPVTASRRGETVPAGRNGGCPGDGGCAACRGGSGTGAGGGAGRPSLPLLFPCPVRAAGDECGGAQPRPPLGVSCSVPAVLRLGGRPRWPR